MQVRRIAAAVILSLPIAATATAEERRELGAHEHGHGSFNVAIDGGTVGLELRVPGADIVGFEHEAKSAKDKAALKAAIEKLKAPLTLFKFPAAAGCKVTKATAEFELDNGHEGHDHHKDEHHHGHAKHKKEKHSGHGHGHDHDKHAHSKEAAAGHAEFHSEYQLNCSAPENLTTVEFAYFGAFKNAQELDVNVATSKGQSKYEVTRDKPTLDLGGII